MGKGWEWEDWNLLQITRIWESPVNLKLWAHTLPSLSPAKFAVHLPELPMDTTRKILYIYIYIFLLDLKVKVFALLYKFSSYIQLNLLSIPYILIHPSKPALSSIFQDNFSELYNAYWSPTSFIISPFFSFWNNFRLTKNLQNQLRVFPYALHSDSPDINI